MSNPGRCLRVSLGWFKALWSTLLLAPALSACSTHDAARSRHWSQLPPLPDARGVAAPFAGVSGGVLLVAGGANFPDKMPWEGGQKVWHDDVYALTAPDARWQSVGKLPCPLAYGVAITTEAGVACIGGSDGERHYQAVLLLVFTNGLLAVHSLPSLLLPLANAAGARVGSTIYVAGGSDRPGEQSALSHCYALDLARKTPAWAAVAPCPGKPRILPVAAALGGSFYLVGGAALEPTNGRVARVYLRDAWRYQPGHGWRRIADLPKPCVAGPTPAPAADGGFLLLSGDDGSRTGFQPLAQHPRIPGHDSRLRRRVRHLARRRQSTCPTRHRADGILARPRCHPQRRAATRRPFAGSVDVPEGFMT